MYSYSMRELLQESAILGSLTPGLAIQAIGYHILGAVVIGVVVIAALAIIGGKLASNDNNHDKKIIPRH